MPFVYDQLRSRPALGAGVSFAAHIAHKHLWRNGVSVVALAGSLALSAAPAWADGGHGSIVLSAASGKGGTDGTLAQATGQNGDVGIQANVGGSGGGGAVDLTTGNGAAGGAKGPGTVTTGVGQVYGTAGATGAAGMTVTTATGIGYAVIGGAGAAGQTAAANVNTTGGGGGGGVGVTTNAALTITATGSATGGAGSGAANGSGGGGGAGIFSTALVTVATGGKVTGGAGGGTGSVTGGGGGGMGAIFAAGGGLINGGTITGGIGGRSLVGGGGDGGAGVWVTGGGTVVNAVGGSITGGVGGAGRFNADVQYNTGGTRGGLGGEGVKGSNITLINAGSISGAMGGASSGAGAPAAALANAVTFLGGVNTLELQAESVITGNVVAFSAADALRLGGDTNASFDVSEIGAAAQYRGFGIYEKTGTSTWTLTGTTSEVTPWTLSGGTLSISSDGNLGATAGTVTFNGGTLQNAASFASARDMTLNAPGGAFETLADLTLSGVISGPGALTKTGAATLTLTGDETYTGETRIQAGTLALAGDGSLAASSRVVADSTFDISGVTAAGTDIQSLAGSGSVSLGAKTLTITNADDFFSGTISGAGGLTISGGTQTLSGVNTYTSATTVEGGTLRAGAVNAFSATSVHNVLAGGTLDLGGFDQTLGVLSNSGAVRFGGSLPGTVLTVTEDFSGTGGTFYLNVALGDDSSVTDLLDFRGSTSGASSLVVNNIGGGGAQTTEGIKVVSVGGESDGTFSLIGDYVYEGEQAVVGGAYAYRLYQGSVSDPSDGDWYLRSALIDGDPTPLYQAGVPVYEAYAGVLQSFNQLGTLQQRLGNRSWTVVAQGADAISEDTTTTPGVGIWGQIEGGYGEFDPETSTTATDYDVSIWRLKAGADAVLSETASGQLIGGAALYYGTASSDISSIFGTGSIDATGYGVSGSLTWYGNTGFYADAQAQLTGYDSDLSSDTANAGLVDGNDGVGYALGIEIGQRIPIAPEWAITPQAQLAWSSVEFADFEDAFGAKVSLDSGDSLIGRLGLAVDRQTEWLEADGSTSRSHVYGIGNLYYDFEDGTSVDVAGTPVDSEVDALWGGLGLGGTYAWAGDRYSLYGEVLAKSQLEDFGDSYALSGTAGFRMTW